MKKRILSLILVAVMAFGICVPVSAASGLGNFVPTAEYTSGQFTDVAAGAWYEPNVKKAFELGLVKGKTANSFAPNGNITLAEVITLAARIHSIYNTGSADFVQGSPWYWVYVEYAVNNGIISAGDFMDYSLPATRAECAYILAASVPESELKAINNIEDIPDVSWGDYWAPAVYALYNAGVLTGNDSYGTFTPESNIKRSEIATIVTRIADPSLRKNFNLTTQYVTLFYPDNRVISVRASESKWFTDYDMWSKTPVSMKVQDGGAYSSYEGVYFWEYGDGLLYIGGQGETPYYNDAPWAKYKTTTSMVYLERGITKIDSFQFYGWTGLSHAEVPDTVDWIDSYAFTGCTNLMSVSIPSSVTYISYNAFDKGADLLVYCEKGSYAEDWANDNGHTAVYASPVYFPDGRSCMVVPAERELYVTNGWYRFPVITLYAGDKTTVISETLINDYIAVGWQDELCMKADEAIVSGGYNAGVEYMEDAMYGMDSSAPMYSVYQAKIDKILGNWRATVGTPIAITGTSISRNSIGTPRVNITFRNISTKTVTALEAFWTCIDAYGNVTTDYPYLYNGNFNGWMEGISLAPGESATYYWDMYSNERTASVKNLRMERCAFADGTTWYYPAWYK